MARRERAYERPPVWAVGGNSRGQLGLGYSSSSSFAPCRVGFQLSPSQSITKVFCGYEHTFALTSTGDVLAFGGGQKGQLGIGNTESHHTPQKVHLLSGKGVVNMAAGLEHSLALTGSGDLYSFGDNLSGQLGLGHAHTPKEQIPQRVPSLCKARVLQMACGQDHSAVLTNFGELFCFGNNRFGALGLAGHDNEGPPVVASAPQLVCGLKGKQVIQIGCGLQHTVALTSAGQVYCWGNNSRGQLGTGDTQKRSTPTLVAKPLSSAKSIHIACGGQHTLALTDKDDLFGFGSDRHGQLALEQEGVIFPVPSRIVRLGGRCVELVVAGAWHTIVKTSTGECYVMGCILPSAIVRQPQDEAEAGGDGTGPAAEGADGVSHGTGRGAPGRGPTSAADPFGLSFGGFRRLMLPIGSEACSKGHSLFYGRGLGPPPRALRKMVMSVESLKQDVSKMLDEQEPDVIFTAATGTVGARDVENVARCASNDDSGVGLGSALDPTAGVAEDDADVGAHLAVLRARCPSLYKHAATAIAAQAGSGPGSSSWQGTDQVSASSEPWRVHCPAGIRMVDLRLVISFLYEDAGIFEWKRRKMKDRKGVASATRSHVLSSVTPHEESSRDLSNVPGRRDASRATAGGARGGDLGDEDGGTAGTGDARETKIAEDKEGTLDGFEGRIGEDFARRLEREDEAILGFSNLGGDATGNVCRGLDCLMALMAAARSLNLTRLQGLCEKRAEAYMDCRTVHKVLRRAAEGGFLYLKRRCLEYCVTHLAEVCAPENSAAVVRELSSHPQVLADVLSLASATEGAKLAAAREMPFEGSGRVLCIEELRGEDACPLPNETYQRDFLGLFESAVCASVSNDYLAHRPGTSFDNGNAKSGDATSNDVGKPTQNDCQGKPPPSPSPAPAWHPPEAQGDFKIRADSGMPAVAVHRCILTARSGFFRGMLGGSMGESLSGELILKLEPTIGMEALLELLRFLYTGRTGVLNPLTALDILSLTKGEHGSGGYFQIAANDELRGHCMSTLLTGLNSHNTLPILVRAKAVGEQEAFAATIEFLLENFHECMQHCMGSPAGVRTNGSPSADEADKADEVPSCLLDDDSPAVDVLLAMAKRCTVTVLMKEEDEDEAEAGASPLSSSSSSLSSSLGSYP